MNSKAERPRTRDGVKDIPAESSTEVDDGHDVRRDECQRARDWSLRRCSVALSLKTGGAVVRRRGDGEHG